MDSIFVLIRKAIANTIGQAQSQKSIRGKLFNMIDIQCIAAIVLSLIIHGLIYIVKRIIQKKKPQAEFDNRLLVLRLL